MTTGSHKSMTDTYKQYGHQLSRQIRRFTILYNPRASQNSHAPRREQIGKAVTWGLRGKPDLFSWQFIETLDPAAAVQIAERSVAAHDSMVVAAGGDQTVSSVAAILSGTKTALGILPCGTANSIARSIGIDTDLEAAVSTLLESHYISMDTFLADGKPYLGSISYGLDSVVPRPGKINRPRILNALRYPYRMAKEVKEFVPKPLRVIVDGTVIQCQPLMVTVSNGEYAGSGVKAVPGSKVTDGLLSVCVIEGDKDQFVRKVIPDILSSSHKGKPGVTILSGKSVIIDADEPVSMRVDGLMRNSRHIEAEVLPGTLKVAAPYVPEPDY
jgi:diacylglycerol kinase (ATP)